MWSAQQMGAMDATSSADVLAFATADPLLEPLRVGAKDLAADPTGPVTAGQLTDTQRLPTTLRMLGPPEEDTEGLFDAHTRLNSTVATGAGGAGSGGRTGDHRTHTRVNDSLVGTLSEVAAGTLDFTHPDTHRSLFARIVVALSGSDAQRRRNDDDGKPKPAPGPNATDRLNLQTCALATLSKRVAAERDEYQASVAPVADLHCKQRLPKPAKAGLEGAAKLVVSIVATLSTANPAHTDYLCELIAELLSTDDHDDDDEEDDDAGAGKPKPAAAARQAPKKKAPASIIGSLGSGGVDSVAHADVTDCLAPITRYLEAVVTDTTAHHHHPTDQKQATAAPAPIPLATRVRAIGALFQLALARASVSDLYRVCTLLLQQSAKGVELGLGLADLHALYAFERAASDAAFGRSTAPVADRVFASESEAVTAALGAAAADAFKHPTPPTAAATTTVPGVRAALFVMVQIDRLLRTVAPADPSHLDTFWAEGYNTALRPILFHPCAIDVSAVTHATLIRLIDAAHTRARTAASAFAAAAVDATAAAATAKACACVLTCALHAVQVQAVHFQLTNSAESWADAHGEACRNALLPLARFDADAKADDAAATTVRRCAELTLAFVWSSVWSGPYAATHKWRELLTAHAAHGTPGRAEWAALRDGQAPLDAAQLPATLGRLDATLAAVPVGTIQYVVQHTTGLRSAPTVGPMTMSGEPPHKRRFAVDYLNTLQRAATAEVQRALYRTAAHLVRAPTDADGAQRAGAASVVFGTRLLEGLVHFHKALCIFTVHDNPSAAAADPLDAVPTFWEYVTHLLDAAQELAAHARTAIGAVERAAKAPVGHGAARSLVGAGTPFGQFFATCVYPLLRLLSTYTLHLPQASPPFAFFYTQYCRWLNTQLPAPKAGRDDFNPFAGVTDPTSPLYQPRFGAAVKRVFRPFVAAAPVVQQFSALVQNLVQLGAVLPAAPAAPRPSDATALPFPPPRPTDVTVDTPHPYQPFADAEWLLYAAPNLPGDTRPAALRPRPIEPVSSLGASLQVDANSLPPAVTTIRFDVSRCATAGPDDYVQLFALNPAHLADAPPAAGVPMRLASRPLSERFYGGRACPGEDLSAQNPKRRRSQWPTAPLVIRNEWVVVYFHSGPTATAALLGRACTPFGLTVSATVEYNPASFARPRRAVALLADAQRRTWQLQSFVHIADTLTVAAWLGTAVPAMLCSRSPSFTAPDAVEPHVARWMRSALFSGGLEPDGADRDARVDDAFLAALQTTDLSNAQARPATPAAPAAALAVALLTRLHAVPNPMAIVRKSIAGPCNLAAQAVFAALLKHTGRLALARTQAELFFAEDDKTRASAAGAGAAAAGAAAAAAAPKAALSDELVKLWKHASAVKLDLRTAYDADASGDPASIAPLAQRIALRCQFLLSLRPAATASTVLTAGTVAAAPGTAVVVPTPKAAGGPSLTRVPSLKGPAKVSVQSPAATAAPAPASGAGAPPLLKKKSMWITVKQKMGKLRTTFKTMQRFRTLIGGTQSGAAAAAAAAAAASSPEDAAALAEAAAAAYQHPLEKLTRSVLHFVQRSEAKVDDAEQLAAFTRLLAVADTNARGKLLGLSTLVSLCGALVAADRDLPVRSAASAYVENGFPCPVALASLTASHMVASLLHVVKPAKALPGQPAPPPPTLRAVHILRDTDACGSALRERIRSAFHALLRVLMRAHADPAAAPFRFDPSGALQPTAPAGRLAPSVQMWVLLCASGLFESSNDPSESDLYPSAANAAARDPTLLAGVGGGGPGSASAVARASRLLDLQGLAGAGVFAFVAPLVRLSRPLPAVEPWTLKYVGWAFWRMLAYSLSAIAPNASPAAFAAASASAPAAASSSSGGVAAMDTKSDGGAVAMDTKADGDAGTSLGALSDAVFAVVRAELAHSHTRLTTSRHPDDFEYYTTLERRFEESVSTCSLLGLVMLMHPPRETRDAHGKPLPDADSEHVQDENERHPERVPLTQMDVALHTCQLVWLLLRACETAAGRARFLTAEWLRTIVGLALAVVPSHLTNIQYYEKQLVMRLLRALLPNVDPAHPAFAAYGGGVALLERLLDTIGEYSLSATASPPSPKTPLVSGVVAADLVMLFRLLLAADTWSGPVNALLMRAFARLGTLHVADVVTNEQPHKPGAYTFANDPNEQTLAHLNTGIAQPLGRILAALWIVGGGSTPVGEGTRVSTPMPGDEFNPDAERVAGTVIRTPASRYRAAGVPPLPPNATQQMQRDSKEHMALVRLHGRTKAGDDDAVAGAANRQQQLRPKGVIAVALNHLRTVDEVAVPLSQLTDGAGIVHAFASFLRGLEADADHLNGPHVPVYSMRVSVVANVRARLTRALSLFTQHRALCASMMQAGVGPLLVPIGLRDLTQAPHYARLSPAVGGSAGTEPAAGAVDTLLYESDADRRSLTLADLEHRLELLLSLSRSAQVNRVDWADELKDPKEGPKLRAAKAEWDKDLASRRETVVKAAATKAALDAQELAKFLAAARDTAPPAVVDALRGFTAEQVHVLAHVQRLGFAVPHTVDALQAVAKSLPADASRAHHVQRVVAWLLDRLETAAPPPVVPTKLDAVVLLPDTYSAAVPVKPDSIASFFAAYEPPNPLVPSSGRGGADAAATAQSAKVAHSRAAADAAGQHLYDGCKRFHHFARLLTHAPSLTTIYTLLRHTNDQLATLYARRCVLSLLHKNRDQLTAKASGSGSPAPAAPSGGPPTLRRTHSVAHALSAFGPAGFLAEFVALCCAAPHQLVPPPSLLSSWSAELVSLQSLAKKAAAASASAVALPAGAPGVGRRAASADSGLEIGLDTLKDVVLAVCSEEMRAVQNAFAAQPPLTAPLPSPFALTLSGEQFAALAPISRNLTHHALTLLLDLSAAAGGATPTTDHNTSKALKREAVAAVRTVVWTFDVLFGLHSRAQNPHLRDDQQNAKKPKVVPAPGADEKALDAVVDTQPVASWSSAAVVRWLQRNAFPAALVADAQATALTGAQLLLCDDASLRARGVPSRLQRLQVLDALKATQRKTTPLERGSKPLVRLLSGPPVIVLVLDSIRAISSALARIALVRLLSRILRVHTHSGPARIDTDSDAGTGAAATAVTVADQWYDLTQRRLCGVGATMRVVYHEEKRAGRGADTRGSFPHSHFAQALVDATLAVDEFQRKYPPSRDDPLEAPATTGPAGAADAPLRPRPRTIVSGQGGAKSAGAGAGEAPKPVHPHPVTATPNPYGHGRGYNCDLCGVHMPGQTVSYHCKVCGYDECDVCRKQRDAATAKAAAAAATAAAAAAKATAAAAGAAANRAPRVPTSRIGRARRSGAIKPAAAAAPATDSKSAGAASASASASASTSASATAKPATTAADDEVLSLPAITADTAELKAFRATLGFGSWVDVHVPAAPGQPADAARWVRAQVLAIGDKSVMDEKRVASAAALGQPTGVVAGRSGWRVVADADALSKVALDTWVDPDTAGPDAVLRLAPPADRRAERDLEFERKRKQRAASAAAAREQADRAARRYRYATSPTFDGVGIQVLESLLSRDGLDADGALLPLNTTTDKVPTAIKVAVKPLPGATAASASASGSVDTKHSTAPALQAQQSSSGAGAPPTGKLARVPSTDVPLKPVASRLPVPSEFAVQFWTAVQTTLWVLADKQRRIVEVAHEQAKVREKQVAAIRARPPWDCPACTYANPPTREACEMCETKRAPEDIAADNAAFAAAQAAAAASAAAPKAAQKEPDPADAPKIADPLGEFLAFHSQFTPRMDEHLAALINQRCEKLNTAASGIDWSGFTLFDDEVQRFPLLTALPDRTLGLRVAFFIELNEWLWDGPLRVAELGVPTTRLAQVLRRQHIRRLVLASFKNALFRKALLDTAAPAVEQDQLFPVQLDMFRAQALEQKGGVDRRLRRTIFGQLYQQLYHHNHSVENKYGDRDRDPHRFHVGQAQRAFKCVFQGLFADDFGGPYNEAIDKLCEELQSPQLSNLFIRCPNARENIGKNRNHFVPNPAARGSHELAAFEFVGRLMGLAVRSGNLLNLDFTSIVWKQLVGLPVNTRDVMAVDHLSFRLLDQIVRLEQDAKADGDAAALDVDLELDATFVTVGSDQKTVPLIENGAAIPVTWETRGAFVQALVHYRVHEFDVQCAAIRRGLHAVVPGSLLQLFTWQQLRRQVCGRPTVDVALLKSVTQYEGCNEADVWIARFWKVLTDKFDDRQRSMFVRFVSGRSRLPSRRHQFERPFKLKYFYPPGNRPADAYLPVSHTCFFALDLPRYSSLEVMHERLLYAVTFCQTIDGDMTANAQHAFRAGQNNNNAMADNADD